MIYFDLDGVLRDLTQPIFGFYPDSWNYKKDGKDIYEIVGKNLDILTSCPPTEYYSLISCLREITILSHQPEEWRQYTDKWLKKWLGHCKLDVNYVNDSAEKLGYVKKGDILVEDYPLYDDYSKIVLIDRPYNKNVKCKRRVRNSYELNRELKILTYVQPACVVTEGI